MCQPDKNRVFRATTGGCPYAISIIIMKITFVGIGWEQLGVCMLSALAKRAGHKVSLAFNVSLWDDTVQLTIPFLSRMFDETDTVLKDIERQKPDVICFSPVTGTYQWNTTW